MDSAATVRELFEVPPLRERFLSDLDSALVAGDERDGWALAFTELVNNAVEHGCRFPDDVVTVRWWGDDAHVVVSVAETNDNGLTQADFDEADCSDFAETGRGAGLFLIRSWADQVQVLRAPGGGTEIRIARRRTAAGHAGSER